MSVTNHERPGVYSVYDASSVVQSTSGGKVVGLVAFTAQGTVGEVVHLYSYAEATTEFGSDESMTDMAKALFLNGATEVIAVAVGEETEYAAAFALLEKESDIAIMVCDSTDLVIQQAMRDSVKTASESRCERIGVVAGGVDESVTDLVTRAEGLNSERMVLVAPNMEDTTGVLIAAAVAGAIAGESDPAVPLGGAELAGATGLAEQYSDNELDTLIRGGVTPVEQISGVVSVVRGVTTRTTTGGVADSTWHELSTILIIDNVIPAVRNSLRAKFPRSKNTAQTRGAIKSQVVVELENRVTREIITSYDQVSVTALEENPTVCMVEFAFAVVHGLNQIWLSAHITV